MLSLLIPSHNCNCATLISGLAEQGRALREELGRAVFDFEILVFDDASTDVAAREANREAVTLCGGRFLTAQENVGAAQGRNTLAQAARFPYLLFIDDDATLCTPDFLARYWADRERADVVCGRVLNPPAFPLRGHELRYRYEKKAEKQRAAAVRNQHPYERFTAFNTLIRRDVFLSVQFDTRCQRYGHEDTLFGYCLEEKGISILHTDNPLIHTGIDTNEAFLRKTETALSTLRQIGVPLTERTPVARWAQGLARWHVAPLFALLFRLTHTIVRRQLRGHHPSLWLLQFYKLGFYLTL